MVEFSFSSHYLRIALPRCTRSATPETFSNGVRAAKMLVPPNQCTDKFRITVATRGTGLGVCLRRKITGPFACERRRRRGRSCIAKVSSDTTVRANGVGMKSARRALHPSTTASTLPLFDENLYVKIRAGVSITEYTFHCRRIRSNIGLVALTDEIMAFANEARALFWPR